LINKLSSWADIASVVVVAGVVATISMMAQPCQVVGGISCFVVDGGTRA